MSSILIEPNVFYTLEEVADRLRVSRAAALRLIKSGTREPDGRRKGIVEVRL